MAEYYIFINSTFKSHIEVVFKPTKVIRGGVEVLFWWGAGEGQASAQAAVVHHRIHEDVWRHHLHDRVQGPDGQVGAVLQRLSRSDNTQMQRGSAVLQQKKQSLQ